MRYILLGGVGLTLLAAALAWTFVKNEGEPGGRSPAQIATGIAVPNGPVPPVPPPLRSPEAQATGTAPAKTVAAAPAPPVAAGIAPSFDVVRIKPNGDAVLAGRAAPGAKVSIIDGGKAIGDVTADQRGEWVFLPTEALPSGARELGLSARHGDGTVIESASVVVLYVPDRARPEPAPVATAQAAAQIQPAAGPAPAAAEPVVVAVATPRSGDGASKVLQGPIAQARPGEPPGVAVDVVDYDEKGEVILSGRGAVGSTVTIYLDNKAIGQAPIDNKGQWQVRPSQPVAPGTYQLRADEASPQGRVTARVELPFMRAEAPRSGAAGETKVIVQPGNSLWRIARHRYGEGLRYAVIYAANKEQIRDPNLIYPGQVFAVPSVN